MGEPEPLDLVAIEPLNLAERIIDGDPTLVILDLRSEEAFSEKNLPGAKLLRGLGNPAEYLSNLSDGMTVVLYDQEATESDVPGTWPAGLEYFAMRGGFEAWKREVLTPHEMIGSSLKEQDFTRRQNQIAGFFSGTRVQSKAAAPPPAMSGGKKKKKPAGGC
jgi:rhodanese-related sulfurtransferase